jgi:hypothetical protein
MPALSDDVLAVQNKDMYKAQFEGYKEMPAKYSELYMVKNGVTGGGDKETQLLGAGRLTRHLTEDQKINFKAPVQGWDFLVKYWTWSDGLALTKNMVEDSVKIGDLMKAFARTWGKMVRVEKETWGARVFNEGGNLSGDVVFNGTHPANTDSSGALLYDSKPMFNLTGNTRSTKGGGTYYNSVAGLTVTAGNFETVYNLHTATNNRDERDEVVQNPADTLLVTPGTNRFLADRIVDTQRGIPGSQLNDVNPYYKIVSVIDWDYLEPAEAAFYVGKRKHEDFQFHERQSEEIRFWRTEDDRGYKASIDVRFGILIKNFRVWSRGGGTSA